MTTVNSKHETIEIFTNQPIKFNRTKYENINYKLVLQPHTSKHTGYSARLKKRKGKANYIKRPCSRTSTKTSMHTMVFEREKQTTGTYVCTVYTSLGAVDINNRSQTRKHRLVHANEVNTRDGS